MIKKSISKNIAPTPILNKHSNAGRKPISDHKKKRNQVAFYLTDEQFEKLKIKAGDKALGSYVHDIIVKTL